MPPARSSEPSSAEGKKKDEGTEHQASLQSKQHGAHGRREICSRGFLDTAAAFDVQLDDVGHL